MREILLPLVEMGAWALPALWLPVAVWTLAALTTEAALRLRPRTHPVVALGVRRAMLWALPVGVLAALALPGLLPAEAAERVAAFTPTPLALPTLTVGGAPEAAGPAATSPVPLAPMLAGLALVAAALVAIVRLGVLARSLWRLRHLAGETTPDAGVQAQADHLARLSGVHRAVRAVTTATPTVPYTYGWRRPVVVVPAELTSEPARLRLVLAHEIAHVARGDFASGVAERAAVALFSWHPLMGALAGRIDLDRERATDAAVLASRPEERRDYADLLLSFSRLSSPSLALGAARGSRSLTSRITTMQSLPLSPARLRRLGRAAQALALTLFLGAVALAGAVAVGPPAQARTLVSPEAATAPASRAVVVPAAPVVAPAPLEEAPADAAPLAPEARVIRGNVTDATTGAPLVGANVVVVDTQIGAATDLDGDFMLNGVDPGDVQIRVTFVGYVPLTVVPQADEELRIGLVPMDRDVRMRQMREAAERRADEARDIDPNSPQAPAVFEVVEAPPALVGGLEALQRSLVYPPGAKADGVEGKVFVQFVINETGGVQDAQALRCPDERLCEAALTAVRAARFTPGRQRGQAVKVRFVLPVDFKLPDSDE
ncbi:TonB family protein [Rubricoccus marinus]|uniref:TonB C-terminal domain-containing protein n=1 Tax=Rubricoccus marinus TaxID=716817 RepID=A0A259TVZ5_9BACT|nr:TonB family protein [Rubricoccus marinus]OZC01866.1 hypothetical protein BSZ36_01995 [Rubricoccus marinus]